MDTPSLALASIGLFLSFFALVFVLASDFGCTDGNVGPAGIRGPIGITGPTAASSLVYYSGQDYVASDLTLGLTQEPFLGKSLLDNAQNFGVSTWVMSVLSGTPVVLSYQVVNSDTQATLITFAVNVSTVTEPRQDLTVELFIIRQMNTLLSVINPSQPTPHSTFVTDLDNVSLAVRCTAITGTAYNRLNSMIIFNETRPDDGSCP